MANVLDRNFDFLTNGTVTAAGLHNLIDETKIYAGLISTQEEKTTVGTADLLLVADSSSIGSPQIAPNRTTVYNLFEDALTGGTYANANLSGVLTVGTVSANRTISTTGTITTGTIPNLTAGTTTSTAATITNGTITTALISTLTAGTTTGTAGIFTSGTIATLNSTTGTIGTLNSTTGTIATLNSTTGTIGNLSTTLAGDFTISQGTGTIGTAKVTPTNLSQPFTSGTAVTSTSGTAIDFTGIPSWAKRVTVMFNGVSTDGTSIVQIQLGASSFSTSGYKSNAGYGSSSAIQYATATSGFIVEPSGQAAIGTARSGTYTFVLIGSNVWVGSGINAEASIAAPTSCAGNSPALSGTLDRIRLTTVNGTDTFDAGSVNIMYEG
jgi:hypothetical protein